MTFSLDMPTDAKRYARSLDFNHQTVPEKLLSEHNLKAGTWGMLCVDKGEVRYFRAGCDTPDVILRSGDLHVIPTQQMHFIQVGENAKFYIEFWRVLK